MSSEVTVGIDIGTSSVKAVAADADGNIVARSRVPHQFFVPSPLQFEHDAAVAWHAGPQQALVELGDVQPKGVSVAATNAPDPRAPHHRRPIAGAETTPTTGPSST